MRGGAERSASRFVAKRGETGAAATHRWVVCSRIRWASVGRAAAILAAVIAGVFSLPAVLGGDAPPPLPPDVGLRTPPATLATPAAPGAAEPPAAPPTAAKRPPPHRHRERRLTRRPARPSDARRRRAGKHHGQSSDSATGAAPAPPQIYEPVPSYSSPGAVSEFRFER